MLKYTYLTIVSLLGILLIPNSVGAISQYDTIYNTSSNIVLQPYFCSSNQYDTTINNNSELLTFIQPLINSTDYNNILNIINETQTGSVIVSHWGSVGQLYVYYSSNSQTLLWLEGQTEIYTSNTSQGSKTVSINMEQDGNGNCIGWYGSTQDGDDSQIVSTATDYDQTYGGYKNFLIQGSVVPNLPTGYAGITPLGSTINPPTTAQAKIFPTATVQDITEPITQTILANWTVLLGIIGLALGIVFVMSLWKRGISLTEAGTIGDDAWVQRQHDDAWGEGYVDDDWNSMDAEERQADAEASQESYQDYEDREKEFECPICGASPLTVRCNNGDCDA